MALKFDGTDLGLIAKQAKEYTDDKIGSINFIIAAILVVLMLGFVQLLIDSFRFSSTTYKEYSQRLEDSESLRRENLEKLSEIQEQQTQILELVRSQKDSNIVPGFQQ